MDFKLLQAILLGVVQGIGEFLPISSSGHLVVIGELLKRFFGVAPAEDTVALVIALHVGTLLSILVVYRRELATIWRRPRLVGLIVLGTIPAGIVGVTFKSQLDATFKCPLLVSCGWLLTALVLWVSQRLERGTRTVDDLPPHHALIIGAFQMLSVVVRGFSRSGSTISGGLLCGMRRDSAAQFSFLLAIPAIGGGGGGSTACVTEFRAGTSDAQLRSTLSSDDLWSMAVGMLVSFVVGLVALQWLLRVISRGKLHWFAVYCAVIGSATVIWQLVESGIFGFAW